MENETIRMLTEVVKALSETNRLGADMHVKTDAVNRRLSIALIVTNALWLIALIYSITY